MDRGRRQVLIFDTDSEESWFVPENEKVPDTVKNRIEKKLIRKIRTREIGHYRMKMLATATAAACVLSVAIFMHEQVYTIRKISSLEKTLAANSAEIPHYIKNQNKILIMNSFISWTDLVDEFSRSDQELETFVPSYLQNNMPLTRRFKATIISYLKESQIATQIKHP